MKIFHMGDWHIGKLVNGYYMTEDQGFLLEQIFQSIKEEKPDVLIIAGDIYDRSVPPIHAIELMNKSLRKIIVELKTPVIAIAGNHDSNERIGFGSEILKSSGLYLKGTLTPETEKITLKDEYGEVDFYPIPYVDPVIVREFFEDKTIKNHDDAMGKIMESIKKDLDPTKRNIAIAHGYITGFGKEGFEHLTESESEKPLSIGGSEYVSIEHFKEFHYTALGHLHGPQKVGSNKARYSGSLMKYSFSEVNQNKGITIVKMDKDGEVTIEFKPLKPLRDFRIIKGNLEDLITKNNQESLNYEDYIKAELEDVGELIDPMAKLRAVYPNVMELVRVERRERFKISESKISSEQIKQKSKLDLFEQFYEDMVGEKCNPQDILIITDIIEKCERGGD